MGKWSGTNTLSESIETRHVYEFGADGSYKVFTEVFRKNRRRLVAHDRGTYRLEGERLSITLKEVKWSAPDAQLFHRLSVFLRFRLRRAQILRNTNSVGSAILHWINDDTVEAVHGDKGYILRRQHDDPSS